MEVTVTFYVKDKADQFELEDFYDWLDETLDEQWVPQCVTGVSVDGEMVKSGV